MSTDIRFPQGPMVDENDYVTLEWREWFQNPQVLSLNFTFALGVESGGTGLTGGTSGGVLAFTAGNVMASSGTLGNHQLVLGGGAGAVPTSLGALGTSTTVLHGNAAGAPFFASVNLSTDVTGDLPYSSLAQGAALSVLGVTGNVTADNASITAGTDNTVLRRSGTAVAFGAVNIASADAVTGVLAIGNGGTGTATPSGTYTPTLTAVTNVSASTAFACQYMRVGNTVTVSGKADVDPTAAGAVELGISLPVASNFAAEENCGGTAAAKGVAGQCAAILADSANDRASMQWVTVDTANRSMYFSFTYQVI